MFIPGSIRPSRWERPGLFRRLTKYTDAGFDTQYQYQGDNYWVTLRGSYIREFDYIVYEKFDGTKLGASGNNTLFLCFWLAM